MKKAKKIDIKCPFCNSDNLIRHGKRNGVQRYKCNTCNHFFTSDFNKISCNRATQRALSVLLNVVSNDFYNNNDFQKAINTANSDKTLVKKVYFSNEYASFGSKCEFRIPCYNPKMLICVDDEVITFIQIPKAKNEVFQNNNSRIIQLSDQISLKGKKPKPTYTPFLNS